MIELIPAIDIIDGKCVRLTKGDYATSKVYNEDPVEVALEIESYGLGRLHVVDLDGAKSKHVVNHRVLHRIASRTSLKIDFGGGIKSDEDLVIAFENGAQMVTVGSVASLQPELFLKWLEAYGGEKMILGADTRDGFISVNGWQEESRQELLPYLGEYIGHGVRNVLCTDIYKDGMLQGPSVELYRQIMATYPTLHLIASGGVSSLDDIRELDEAGIPAVVFGKALYEGRFTLKQLSDFMG
ncbi:MAG: 1-(5-phosphoribosyl)-5-[Bacteroidaceae bacterium]|nr:1-(5-phosphoribosyl)-5-[(5-phosphoribosylamino)methylideneamino]imidazole-4-carboxamide isomerase [Bacteroidaceae bacterium]